MSLIFGHFNDREIGGLEDQFDEFRGIIAKMLPLLPPQEVLVEVRDHVRESRAYLQDIADQLAEQIGERFGQSIEELLLPALQGLTQSVEQQVTNAASSSVESARSFTSELADHLTGEIKGSFEDMAQTVTRFGGEFDAMTGNLKSVVTDISQSAESQRNVLAEAMKANDLAANRQTETMNMMNKLPDLLQSLEGLQAEAGRIQTRQLAQGDTQATKMAELNGQLAAAADRYAETANSLRAALDAVNLNVDTLTRAIDAAARNANTAGQTMGEAATRFSTRIEQENALVSKLVEAGQSLSRTYQASQPTLDRFGEVAAEVVEQFKHLQELQASASQTAVNLRESSNTLSGQLTDGARMLGQAGTALGSVASDTQEWANQATNAIEQFGQGLQNTVQQSLISYDQSLSNAVASLDGAIKNLVDLVDEVADSTQQRT